MLLAVLSCSPDKPVPTKKEPDKETKKMEVAYEPKARVLSYVYDWHAAWKRVGISKDASQMGMQKLIQSGGLDEWENTIKDLDALHWAEGRHDEADVGPGWPPEHDPDHETVRTESIEGDKATVETVHTFGSQTTYHEYQLTRKGGQGTDWRIVSKIRFFDKEDDVAFTAAERDAILAKVRRDAKLPPHEPGDEPNCEILFKDGHTIQGTLMSKPETIRVKNVGKLALPSGAIMVRDFRYSPDDALPLSLGVPPGSYDVEICQLHDDGSIGAVRVVFDSENKGPFVYRSAVTTTEEKDYGTVGVDAGNVSICDARDYISRTLRAHERDCQSWLDICLNRVTKIDDVTFLKLHQSAEPNAVIVSSGHGDGGYPVYWVFDQQQNLVSLVVDFQVAAEHLFETIVIPWRAGLAGIVHSTPGEKGYKVQVDRQQGVSVSGREVDSCRWLDMDNKVVQESGSLGAWDGGSERGWSVDFGLLDGRATQLELKFYTGYRNNR